MVKNVVKSVGRIEGKRENTIEIAQKLLKEGISIDIISNTTGLSIKEIEGLKK